MLLAAQQFHKFLPFLPFEADQTALARVAALLHIIPRPTTRRTSLSACHVVFNHRVCHAWC